jgi:release factor glutamine methyltransferase
MIRVSEHTPFWLEKLRKCGIPSPEREWRRLLAHLRNCSIEQIWSEENTLMVSEEEWRKLQHWVQRRLLREPLAKIIGSKEFYGRSFSTSRWTLDPRPESEEIIDAARRVYPDSQSELIVLDWGTGTGCLLVTWLSLYSRSKGVGVDRSVNALAVAEVNGRAHGVESRIRWIQSLGDTQVSPEEQFHLILANPPYVAEADPLNPEATYDPPEALYGGETDGLNTIRQVLQQSAQRLYPQGWLCLEMGPGQWERVSEYAKKQKTWESQTCILDTQGIPRVGMFQIQ